MFSYLEASRSLGIIPEFQELSLKIRSLSIDTRSLNPGDLFVAFQGERCDGHDFLAMAFEKGASGAIIDLRQRAKAFGILQTAKVPIHNVFCVPDPQLAMTQMALAYRKTLPVKVIGITGSVGKTTTKEFLFYLLGTKHKALATSGNLNNHLGVPIMLSRLEPSHQFAVLEMGASHVDEIRALADMALPAAAILTPIGPAHLEGFGSLDNVYQTKLELADSLKSGDPLVVRAEDETLLRKIKEKNRVAIKVGFAETADYRITEVQIQNGEVSFCLNGHGPFCFAAQAGFIVLNAALALAMAHTLGLAWDEFPLKWNDVGFAAGRFRETMLPCGVRIIDDSYNANPVSFANALDALRCLPGKGKRFVVFADMLELGSEEARFHRELGEKIAASGVDFAFAFGDRSRGSIDALTKSSARCQSIHFRNGDEIVPELKSLLSPGDIVLFKGSRSMHVEKVLEGIRHLSFSLKP